MTQTNEYKQLPLFIMPRHQLPAPSHTDGLFGVAVTIVNADGVSVTHHADGTKTIKAAGESEPCLR